MPLGVAESEAALGEAVPVPPTRLTVRRAVYVGLVVALGGMAAAVVVV